MGSQKVIFTVDLPEIFGKNAIKTVTYKSLVPPDPTQWVVGGTQPHLVHLTASLSCEQEAKILVIHLTRLRNELRDCPTRPLLRPRLRTL